MKLLMEADRSRPSGKCLRHLSYEEEPPSSISSALLQLSNEAALAQLRLNQRPPTPSPPLIAPEDLNLQALLKHRQALMSKSRHSLPSPDISSSFPSAFTSSSDLSRSSAPQSPGDWESMLDTAIQSIVSISGTHVRCFDTDVTGTFHASGFIVDAKQGLILSNRHVVSPGPTVARATFASDEEVEVRPVYRDPVHDFGFFQFDPREVQSMPVLRAISLCPEGARLGTEIRVVGNDSNEKLSIQQGTLARLDRPAPDYGPGRYNDFNTFYLQASSNCSGGSSGSPVLNRHGQAIALNAGANTQSTHSYYLPLDRVVPALQALQNGDRPRRGTVGVEWVWVSLQQAKRLGLKPTEGMAARKGVLVVDRLSSSSVAPVGKDMEVGDMLLEIDEEIVSSFVDLERVLDEHVGQSVLFKLQRGSDDVITVRIDVQEIQEVTELVEWSQAVFHPLSLHLQRHLRPSGDQKMVVAQCGYLLANAGVPSGSILLALDGKQVTHVSSLIDILKELKNGQDVSVKFQPLSFTSPGSHSGSHAGSVKGNERVQTVRMHVDHLENFPFRLGKRNDKEGRWDYQELQATKGNPNVLHQPPPLKANPSLKTNSIGQHLVWVVARSPLTLEGYCQTLFKGTGVIIQGLILCQRSSLVPHACMSIDVYFPHETQSRCGRLVFQHPQFDFCFVQVDTMPATQDQPLPLMDPMCIRQVQPGTCMTLVSLLDAQRTVLTCDVSVDAMCLQQPLASPLIPPRFRSLNSQQMKCVPNAVQESANRNSGSRASEQHLLHSPQTIGRASGGILVHPQQGAVYALWLCSDADTDTEAHGYGMPMTYIYPVLEALRQQRPSVLHRLEVELEQVSIQEVFDQGLKAEDAIGRESLLRVHSVSVLTPTVVEKERGETLEGLEEGDIILSIQQQAVTDVEDLHAFLFGLHTADPILLHIECLRHGRRDSCRQWTSTQVIPRLNLSLNSLPLLPTVPRPVLLGWCGAILMHAYTAVLQQVDRQSLPSPTYPIHEYPYITSVLLGSPCESHHLPSGYFVLEVDGQDTRVGKGQDALTCWQRVFCGQTKKKFVRVKVMHRNGRVRVLSLWLDLHYWPTWIVDQKGSVLYL